VGLTARHLEENGIATVIIGSALDIIEYCGVPRYLFTDLPLGNPLGHPGDTDEQQQVVDLGLTLFESAIGPNRTLHAPVRWSASDDWRARYAQVRPEDRARLQSAGEARRALRESLRVEGRLRD
jgi:hypothetical protein